MLEFHRKRPEGACGIILATEVCLNMLLNKGKIVRSILHGGPIELFLVPAKSEM